MPYYAVRDGRTPGVYNSWGECRQQTDRYSGATFQKFSTAGEAQAFVNGGGSSGGGRSYGGSSYGGGYSSSKATVYVDGSCPSNGRSGSRAGIGVYWGDDHPMNVSEPLSYGRPTNNRAELEAASRAIGQAQAAGYDHVDIRTDSKFLKDGVEKWTPRWKENGWKLSGGGDVKNRDGFEKIDRQLQNSQTKVTITHVPGHAGIRGNEQADRLANEGARKYKY